MIKKIKGFLFRNVTARQTVVKNTFWLTASQVGGRFTRAIIIVYAARVLGAAGWGVFSYATTFVAFLTLFTDAGIGYVLTKEVARAKNESERAQIFSTSFIAKGILMAIGFFVIVYIAPRITTIEAAKVILPVVSLIFIFDTLREFCNSVARGLEKMEWDAAAFLATNVAIVALGFVSLRIHPTVKAFTYAYVFGTGIGAIIAVYLLRGYFAKVLSVRFSFITLKMLLRAAWPIAIAGALGMLTTNTDVLIIGWMKTVQDVGFYSATMRIIQLLYLLPSILTMSLLPIFARLVANRDHQKFRTVLERTLSLAFLFAIPLVFGGILLGKELIAFVFGNAYLPAAHSFQVLMLTMLVDFPAVMLTTAAFAYDHQKKLMVYSAIGGIFNVIFDLLLIPRFGITGSAFATLFAQSLSNFYLWHTMKKINHFRVLPFLKKIIFSSVIVTAAVYALSAVGLHVVLIIAIAAIFYLILLRVFKEPLLNEVWQILRPKGTEPVVVEPI